MLDVDHGDLAPARTDCPHDADLTGLLGHQGRHGVRDQDQGRQQRKHGDDAQELGELFGVLLPGQSPGARTSGRFARPLKPGWPLRCRGSSPPSRPRAAGWVVQQEREPVVPGVTAQGRNRYRGAVEHDDVLVLYVLPAREIPGLTADRKAGLACPVVDLRPVRRRSGLRRGRRTAPRSGPAHRPAPRRRQGRP